jgi:hypothetical protein
MDRRRWRDLIRTAFSAFVLPKHQLQIQLLLAIGRKNYLFLGSDNGGKSAAILYSIMASTKANQVEPFAYVRDLLCQLSGCAPPEVAALIPDAWLVAHPESCRCWSR